ncbi:hypothetical protein BA171_07245 [Candidatus Hamiltonella defensa (Bemisia tabaci)]|uniref:Uncharacterized protein n=1 Tax=Candidatus Hamiltonella defensa (Bemisia tabaci) TaxID=672795 RepID=A0A249E0W8_9ENTR|nr:hypothetical protein BA171_07245 [Candidatus Hamiltonella defensa (Bemisia tabaci)]
MNQMHLIFNVLKNQVEIDFLYLQFIKGGINFFIPLKKDTLYTYMKRIKSQLLIMQILNKLK